MSERTKASGQRGHGRWYGMMMEQEPRGVVQFDSRLRQSERDRKRFTLPEGVLRLAQAEYDRQYSGQPYERMQERGGLSLLEIVGLLADALERHGGLPSAPATKEGDRWVAPAPPHVPFPPRPARMRVRPS